MNALVLLKRASARRLSCLRMPYAVGRMRAVGVPAVPLASAQNFAHKMRGLLPVGSGHGVPACSLMPLQSARVPLPMRAKHFGHVPGAFGVGPQVIAGLQQAQAARGQALQQVTWRVHGHHAVPLLLPAALTPACRPLGARHGHVAACGVTCHEGYDGRDHGDAC